MNKTEALKRLSSLEEEAKELRKIMEAPEDIKSRIKSFKDACEVTGYSEKLPYPDASNKIQHRMNYDYMMSVIAKALNEQWVLDWNNSSQQKWYPWMEYNKASSAFRFLGSGDVTSYALAGSGVRLATKDLSDYFGKQFEELISKHLLTL